MEESDSPYGCPKERLSLQEAKDRLEQVQWEGRIAEARDEVRTLLTSAGIYLYPQTIGSIPVGICRTLDLSLQGTLDVGDLIFDEACYHQEFVEEHSAVETMLDQQGFDAFLDEVVEEAVGVLSPEQRLLHEIFSPESDLVELADLPVPSIDLETLRVEFQPEVRMAIGQLLQEWFPLRVKSQKELFLLKTFFTSCRSLLIWQGHGDSKIDLQALPALPHLECLDLDGSDVSDEDLFQVALLPRIRELRVHQSRVFTKRGLGALVDLPLEKLDLSWCRHLDDDDLAFLVRMRDLRFLSLAYVEITDSAIAFLAQLEKLEELDVSHSSVSDEGLRQLVDGCPELKFLGISDCMLVTAVGIGHLARLSRLKVLDLSGFSELTDEVLEALGNLENIEEIYLVEPSSVELTAGSAKHLKKCCHLKKISVFSENPHHKDTHSIYSGEFLNAVKENLPSVQVVDGQESK